MKCLSAVLLVLLSGCVGGSDSFAGSRADPLILGHDQIAGLILMLSVIGVIEPRVAWFLIGLTAFFVLIRAILLM